MIVSGEARETSALPVRRPSEHSVPRLLFVSHHFPPDTSIGSRRSRRIASWMRRLGWEVDVLAARSIYQDGRDDDLLQGLDGVRVVRTHELNPRAWAKAIRARRTRGRSAEHAASPVPVGTSRGRLRLGLARLAHDWLAVPDPWIGWLPNAMLAAERLPRPDLVLATIPTFSNALVAAVLSYRFRVPLVLDYRDPWNPRARRYSLPALRVRIEAGLEAFCLRRATRLTATTQGVAAEVSELAGKHVDVVFNACEPEGFAEVAPRHFDRPTLLYTGNLYGGRTLDAVLDALTRMGPGAGDPQSGPVLHYIGAQPEAVVEAARARAILDRVVVESVRPHREALAAMAGAQANLCVVAPEHSRQIPAKVFEQIASGRPVLAIAPRGSDIESLLTRLGIGRCVPSGDPAALDAALAQILEAPGPTHRATPAQVPEPVSAGATMSLFDETLRDALAGRGLPPRSDRMIQIAAMGDVMIPERIAALLQRDALGLFGPAGARLRAADIGFVNLETPLVADAAACPSSNPLQPVFLAPAALAHELRAAGVRVANLANNHIADAGAEGIRQTRAACEAAGIAVCGAGRDLQEARRPAILDVDGVRVGFLGYSAFCSALPNAAGCATLDLAMIRRDVRALRRRVHHVVVSIHAGIEYAPLPAGVHRELYRAVADAGADLVLGHHPHVWQGHERRGDSAVIYSLGNALADTGDKRVKAAAFERTALVIAGLAQPDLDDPRTEDAVVATVGLRAQGAGEPQIELCRIGPDFRIHAASAHDRARFDTAASETNRAIATGTDPRFALYDRQWESGTLANLSWRLLVERWRRIRPRHLRAAIRDLAARLRGAT